MAKAYEPIAPPGLAVPPDQEVPIDEQIVRDPA